MRERAGVRFDTTRARETWDKIAKEMAELEDKINPHLPVKPTVKSKLSLPPKNQFKKDGTPNANTVKKFGEGNVRNHGGRWQVCYPQGEWVDLPTTRPLNPTSPMGLKDNTAIKQWLMDEKGWIPQFWNFSDGKPTSPKIHENGVICPGLEATEWEHVEDFITYCSIKHRHQMIWGPKPEGKPDTGLLGRERLKVDGRIGAASSGITNTHRLRHKDIVNLPGVDRRFGKEIRGSFIASEGNVLVGYDASSIEARCKGHLTYKYDGGEYARKILDDSYDEHMENAKIWFEFDPNDAKAAKKARTSAKPGTYALTV